MGNWLDDAQDVTPQVAARAPQKESSWLDHAQDVTPEESQDWLKKTANADTIGTGTAAAAGAIQGLTMDFGDEIGGAFASPKGAVKRTAEIVGLRNHVSDDADVLAYEKKRDLYRHLIERARQEHPYVYGGASLAGAVAGPGKFIKGATTLKGALMTGGLLGATAGTGMSTGDTAGEIAKDAGLGLAIGAPLGAAGYGIAKGAGYLAGKAFRSSPVSPEAEEVAAAVKGVSGQEKVPGYMVTDDPTTKRVASTLYTEPTIGGHFVRQEMNPIMEGVNKTAADLSSDASNLSHFETGNAVRQGLQKSIADKFAPAGAIYEKLEGAFEKTPINGLAWKRGVNQLRKQYSQDFTGQAEKLINQVDDVFTNKTKTVQDLRQLRTHLGKLKSDMSTPDIEKGVAGDLYDILTRERDRSILQRALVNGPKNIRNFRRNNIVQEMKGADRMYGDTARELKGALPLPEGGRNKNIQRVVREWLDNTPPETLAKQLFDKNNVGRLNALKKSFPAEYEQLRKRALGDLVDNATTKSTGEFSPRAFTGNVFKQPPEVQQALLGDKLAKAKQLQTVFRATPKEINPSGTSIRIDFGEVGNPVSNAMSVGKYGWLKGTTPQNWAGNADNVIARTMNNPKTKMLGQVLQSAKKRGSASYGSTYFLLMNTQPHFRELMGEEGYDPSNSGE
jgi:hypothetical protein